MFQQIVSAAAAAAAVGFVGFVGAFLKKIGPKVGAWLGAKASEALESKDATKRKKEIMIAEQVFRQVDETFRISKTLESTIENKQAMFAIEIKKVLPGLTDDEIVQLRQSIAGFVNEGKASLMKSVSGFTGAAEAPAAAAAL